MQLPEIRSASQEERQAVLDVLTLAFASDPMARWAAPDAGQFLASFPEFADAMGGNGLGREATCVVHDFAGAAMWLPPGVEPDVDRILALFQEHSAPELLPDLLGVFEQMGRYHPQEPHWYLPVIGVDPAYQGRGIGSLLMRHALRRCDEDGLPAYLESSNPRNLSLYLRFGFEIVGRIQVGTSPPVVPMLRPAR
jgi:ribosomal protein S18 acetylase RimI-like enzyme